MKSLNEYMLMNFGNLKVFYQSQVKPNDLYEILLIYNSRLKNPFAQNPNYYSEFIKYNILNKDFYLD